VRHQKTVRATSFGHAVGTAQGRRDRPGPVPSRCWGHGDRRPLGSISVVDRAEANHPAGQHLRARERARLLAAVSLGVVAEGPLAGEGRWRRRPNRHPSAPIRLETHSISLAGDTNGNDSGDMECRSDRRRYERECAAQRWTSTRGSWPRDQLPSGDKGRHF
jgi:hypothetical protein